MADSYSQKPPHETKKFSDYLREFLMIFLAVSLGFMADSTREKFAEHNQEKTYIKSMIEDLEKDTLNIDYVIKDFIKINYRLDTILALYDTAVSGFSPSWTLNFIDLALKGYTDFFYTDRTLQQLKNSGGMRLIASRAASNGIIEYDAQIKQLDKNEIFLSDAYHQIKESSDKIWNYRKMYQAIQSTSWKSQPVPPGNYWISHNPESIEYLYNTLGNYKRFTVLYVREITEIKKIGLALMEDLKKEYKL